MKSSAAEIYQLSFQVSPIILTGGITQLMLGAALPIISLLQSVDFLTGLLSSGNPTTNLDQFFAHFKPLPGASLVSNKYGEYPFANQSVAANAVIGEPLKIGMLMTLQIKSFAARLATMTALQATLNLHSNMGGSYIVVTPSNIYPDCVLDELACAGDAGTQSQVFWHWIFHQPLLSEQQAVTAMNGMMSKIDAGLPSTGALSGAEVVGSSSSLASPSFIPAAGGLTGSNTSGFFPQ